MGGPDGQAAAGTMQRPVLCSNNHKPGRGPHVALVTACAPILHEEEEEHSAHSNGSGTASQSNKGAATASAGHSKAVEHCSSTAGSTLALQYSQSGAALALQE